MDILIASESFIIKDSLGEVFKELLPKSNIRLKTRLCGTSKEELLSLYLIFIEFDYELSNELEIIRYIKTYSPKTKVIVLDRNKSKNIFTNLVQSNIDGYIVNIKDKMEFIYTIKKVLNGKKAYEADLVETVINNKYKNNIEVLTNREKEVLYEIAKGLNNKEIAKNLYITEYTVKKHVSHILDKLDFKNRQEAILYITNKNTL
ncbi:MAG: response regulator transcription factor [Romboutsia sp.]